MRLSDLAENRLEKDLYEFDMDKLYYAFLSNMNKTGLTGYRYDNFSKALGMLCVSIQKNKERTKSTKTRPILAKTEKGAFSKILTRAIRTGATGDDIRWLETRIYPDRKLKYNDACYSAFLDAADAITAISRDYKGNVPFMKVKGNVIDADEKKVTEWLTDFFYVRDLSDYQGTPKEQKAEMANKFYRTHKIAQEVKAEGRPPLKSEMRRQLYNKLMTGYSSRQKKAIYRKVMGELSHGGVQLSLL